MGGTTHRPEPSWCGRPSRGVRNQPLPNRNLPSSSRSLLKSQRSMTECGEPVVDNQSWGGRGEAGRGDVQVDAQVVPSQCIDAQLRGRFLLAPRKWAGPLALFQPTHLHLLNRLGPPLHLAFHRALQERKRECMVGCRHPGRSSVGREVTCRSTAGAMLWRAERQRHERGQAACSGHPVRPAVCVCCTAFIHSTATPPW